ncbi:MAG: prepilin peptidase [Rhodospirillales bacterium]|nr:prepilin peptidase [Rhodospirillales bacterium]
MLFVLNRLGGGDVKLLAAAACWTGFAILPDFLIVVGLAGGVLALGLLVIRRLLRGRIAEDSPLARLLGQTRDVPYGIAIAAGGIVVWPKMDLVTRFLIN